MRLWNINNKHVPHWNTKAAGMKETIKKGKLRKDKTKSKIKLIKKTKDNQVTFEIQVNNTMLCFTDDEVKADILYNLIKDKITKYVEFQK